MSTFYLLPARSTFGDQVADVLGRYLPGVDWTASSRQRLAEVIVETLALRDGVYLVFRDELPLGAGTEASLVEGFGAEVGDEVVEVRGGQPARRWRVSPIHPLAA